MEELQAKLQELAQKGLSVKDPDSNAIARLVVTVVFFSTLWWTQYKLAQEGRALAAAEAEADHLRLQAAYDLFLATKARMNDAATALLLAACENAKAAVNKVAAAQAVLAANVVVLNKIANFEDLNALAGIKS